LSFKRFINIKNISYIMKKKNSYFVFGIIAVLVVALIVIFTLNDNGKNNSSENTALNTPSKGVVSNALDSGSDTGANTDSGGSSSSGSSSGVISESELSTHNKQSDCWVAYKGKVYDITDFLPKHPGSAGAIAPYCGTSSEFETAFTRQHGTSKATMLMKVGVLMGDFDNMGNLQ
jgi:predicted heme/steroid binding protein